MTTERNIAILGSTGSIGQNALEVIRQVPRLKLFGVSGHRQLDRLAQIAHEFQPRYVVCSDADFARSNQFRVENNGATTVLYGSEGLQQLAADPQVDTVLASIVGCAGLDSTWQAIAAGKRIALANKETLVTAGKLITDLAKTSGASIIPVDSEHSAIFQALQLGRTDQINRMILTASGGPFRDFSSEQLAEVSVEQALAHPTWEMGGKITIDSATMMNKALEIIEARWLFDVSADQIDVVIHPQSIVHSMVEYCDGSTIAQLSPPDMKLPIQYALTFPDRLAAVADRLDLTRSFQLDFFPPDLQRFPSLGLGFEVAERGGTTGVVLNAANEAAVAAFLAGDIPFTDIFRACRSILDHHDFESEPDLNRIRQLDQWARKQFTEWMLTR